MRERKRGGKAWEEKKRGRMRREECEQCDFPNLVKKNRGKEDKKKRAFQEVRKKKSTEEGREERRGRI